MSNPNDLMTSFEACSHLRVSRQTLLRWVRKGIVTPLRLGKETGHFRFYRKDIESLLKKNTYRGARFQARKEAPARAH